MNTRRTGKRGLSHRRAPAIILLLSVLVFLFYFIGFVWLSNVYTYPAVGAVYELLSLPMLLLLAGLPILNIILLFKKKGVAGWQAYASLIFLAAAIIILIQQA